MSDFFNWDNKFMTAMSKASDAILLGILCISQGSSAEKGICLERVFQRL